MTRAEMGVCRRILAAIEREERRAKGLKEAIERLTAVIDGMPRGGGYRSRVEEMTAAAIDSQRGVMELRAILVICQVELRARLEASVGNAQQRAVLFCRYGRCLPYAAIAMELSYSVPHVFRLHRAGLKKILE